MLGPNPTQERFSLAAYYLTDLAFQASGNEPLAWGDFTERYTAMYPRGQHGLTDDPVTAYVNNLRDRRRPGIYDDSEGTKHAALRPHVGVQCLCGLDIE
jgi:hypothetical protein